MKLIRGLPIILAALLAVASCEAPPADHGDGGVEKISQAITFHTSPYSAPAGVLAVVGSNNGSQWLVFWRSTDSHCTWAWLGGAAMNDSIRVDAVPAAFADMRALGAGQNFLVGCSGGTFGAGNFNLGPIGGARGINFVGTNAPDYFNCSSTGGADMVCNGMDGADIFDSQGNCNVAMYGGFGNDKIRVNSLPVGCINPAPSLFGQDGNDCLTTPTTQGIVDCGSGSDTSNKSGTGCESVVPSTTCP